MFIVYSLLFLLVGNITGYRLYKRQLRKKTKVIIPVETFDYLIERDNELWEIERDERSKISFDAPSPSMNTATSKVRVTGIEVDLARLNLN